MKQPKFQYGQKVLVGETPAEGTPDTRALGTVYGSQCYNRPSFAYLIEGSKVKLDWYKEDELSEFNEEVQPKETTNVQPQTTGEPSEPATATA